MILGIDPGISGALATWDGESLTVVDMPTYERPAGARNTMRRFIDEPALVRWIHDHALLADALVLEQVGGRPGQSGHSAFVFGRGVGVIMGAALLMGLKVEEVHPARWKGALSVPSDKSGARARASELMPAWCNLWRRARDDGRAEASLIAYYGHQILGEQS